MEYVKGELEINIGKYNYHKLCRVGDTEHKDILENLPTEQAIAYLKELVRRWNAFEEDGLVSDLLAACEAVKNIKNKIYGFDVGKVIKKVEAAIASAKA